MSTPERAGWYDDPEDETHLRYFDGVIWSEHRVPRQTRSAEPVPPAAADPTSPSSESGPGRDVFGRQMGGHQPQQPVPPGWGPAPTAPTTPDGQELASYGARAGAYLIDTVILTGLVLLASGWAWWAFMGDYWNRAMEDSLSGAAEPVSLDEVSQYLQYLNYEYLFIAVGITVLVQAAYGIGFLVATGATPGKMMAGISVRRADRPGKPGFGTAFMRMLLPLILRVLWVLTCMVEIVFRATDLLWPLRDSRRQALHDKIAGTVVVVNRRQ